MNDLVNYSTWIGELKQRYRDTQIKAAVAVNSALLEFYWELGRDISERYPGRIRDAGFFKKLSLDLKLALPEVGGLSERNIRYSLAFYRLYNASHYLQQAVANSSRRQVADGSIPNVAQQLFLIPWGHHCVIMDKCKCDAEKAFFYVCKTISQGWSRAVLLNMLGTDLYEREGRAQTNFEKTMIPAESALARQITKDPFVFEVQGLAEPYRERELKAAVCANIEHLLMQMGKGVAFLGREYRLEVGDDELFVDLLFYVIPLRRYLVMEVKTDKFRAEDFGQLQGYVSVVNHQLNLPDDKPAIGLLVCREHNRLLAQYLMEDAKTPLAVSDYEILRILPDKIASELPSIADIEAELAKSGEAR